MNSDWKRQEHWYSSSVTVFLAWSAISYVVEGRHCCVIISDDCVGISDPEGAAESAFETVSLIL